MRISDLMPIILTVNHEEYEVRVSPSESLADVLREKLGLTGIKLMCNDGECGTCTVLIDGKPILSCITLAIECESKNILTIEGLADLKAGKLHPLQQAFIELSGMQCGTCTPGIILTAKALMDKNSNPTEDEIREALSGNLCRCGNYKRIVQCVMLAGKMMRREGVK